MQKLPKKMEQYLAPARKTEAKFNPTKTFEQSPVSEVGYTSGGNPSDPCPQCDVRQADGNDNYSCYAKRVAFDGENGIVEKYFIKFGIDGFTFDPWGGFSEGSANKYAKLHGRPSWVFKEVNKRAFEFYKSFLQTRNKAWKNNAEREITNG